MFAITSRATDDWRDELLIRLHTDGSPRGPIYVHRHVVSADQHCSARQFHSVVTTAFLGRHRDGGYAVLLSNYGSDGELLAQEVIRTPTRPLACTIATSNNQLALAIRFPDHVRLQAFHAYVYDLAPEAPSFSIPSSADEGPLSMTALRPIGREYALLHRAADHTLRVTRFAARGVQHDVTLPIDVDALTADIGANDRGVYVTWIRGHALNHRGIDVGATEYLRLVPGGARTRTDGLWDHCATAVHSARDNAVTFTQVDDCP